MSGRKSAVIIGAGYAGMALANLLGKAGYKVDVFEKNKAPGGRIAAIKKDGYVFDLGPSWYLMPEVFEQYYKLFGKSASKRLDLVRFDPGYKVFFENHESVLVRGDVDADVPLFEQIEPGAGQKLRSYVDKSSAAYELAVKHFLYNNHFMPKDILKADIIRKSPQMLMLLGKTLDRYVRSNFRDKRLQQILEYHSVFLGSSPFEAPAIYTLMSHLDFRSGIYYPRRGMLSLASDMRELGQKYDITYHFDSPVESVIVEKGRATGVVVRGGIKHRADVVVSNADLHFTETKLLALEHQSFPETYWQKRQAGPSALLLSLGVRGNLPELQHHNLYFVEDWRENFDAIYGDKKIPKSASLYVCNPTKTDPSLAPRGHENLFILVPIPSGLALTARQQENLVDKTIKTLSRAIGVNDLAERVTTKIIFGPKDFEEQFNAWDYNAFGGESHILKQSILFRTPNNSNKVKNLYYVGAGTVPGIGLPMCLIGAQLTYKRIVGSKKPGPLTKGELR